MNDKNQPNKKITARWLDMDEVRLVSDLRIMHAKVDELYQIVQNLRRRHNQRAICDYADYAMLQEDIDRVDQMYLWFVSLREEAQKKRA